MTLTEDQLPLMAMLTYVSRAKCIVDIGTFTGVSALQFALVANSLCVAPDQLHLFG